MVREAIDQWPAVIQFNEFPELKITILDPAIFDMRKIVQSKLYYAEVKILLDTIK